MRSDESYIAHFQTYLLTEKRAAQNTFLAYKNDIEQLEEFFKSKKLSIENSKTSHLKSFIKVLREKGLKNKSLIRKISSFKVFFKYLEDQFELKNIAEPLILPKLEQTLPLYLTDAEIESLFETANQDKTARGIRNQVMIYLLYASGMRVSELVHLTVDQINFETGFVQLMGKGNKERSIPLPGNILSFLKYYLDKIRKEFLPKNKVLVNANYIFPYYSHNKVTPITRQSVFLILKKMIALSGINKNISPHSLRHSLATHLLKNGANLRSIQMLLGHEHLSTIQVYTHVETSHLRKVYDKKHPRAK